MRYLDAYRQPGPVAALLEETRAVLRGRKAVLMEVCGTHTVAIFRSGLRQALPDSLELLSGPGCPVCVTPNRYLDRAVAYARLPGTTLATFGDMVRVPGSSSSLEREKAAGADVRVVYSPLESVELAAREPGRQVVFLGVGFETTAPSVAACIIAARQRGLKNYSVLCGHKTVPQALRALAADPEFRVDGLILPGHVSSVIGSEPYRFLCEEFGIPAVITGFEPTDIVSGVLMLARQIAAGEARLEIQYRRGVPPEGNPKAVAFIRKVFAPVDSVWRGIGDIPGSGLRIRPEYAAFDAQARFDVAPEPERTAAGCLCGNILRGVSKPPDCALFGSVCTPLEPVGACMVSSEGTCAAYHEYARQT